MARLRIIIDTREQTPWAFDPAAVDAEIGTLKTADYALEGDDAFGIERKSLEDFLGTIASGWQRFEREIERMADWPARVIIVEGDYATCCFSQAIDGSPEPPSHRHFMLTPQFIEKRIAQLTMRNVSVLFATDCHLAAGLAVAVFRQRQFQINEKQKNNESSKN